MFDNLLEGKTPSQNQYNVFKFVNEQVNAVKEKRDTKSATIQAVAGSGKCLGIDTEIIMYDGTIKKVQDIIVGDELMGPDCKPRLVTNTNTGVGPLFQINQRFGNPFVCNDVHVMTVKHNNEIIDIPLNEIEDHTQYETVKAILPKKLFHEETLFLDNETNTMVELTDQTQSWDYTELGEGTYYGFTLEGDGRFLLSDFTVTHNTSTIVAASKLLDQSLESIFIAFNKSIADELESRLPSNVKSRTINSVGNSYLRAYVKSLGGNSYEVKANKNYNLIRKFVTDKKKHLLTHSRDMVKVISICKANGITPDVEDALPIGGHSDLETICEIILGGEYKIPDNYVIECANIIRKVINLSFSDQHLVEGVVDFDDQKWITVCKRPINNGLTTTLVKPEYDCVFVDEIQDLNMLDIELVKMIVKPSGFVIGVGDRYQCHPISNLVNGKPISELSINDTVPAYDFDKGDITNTVNDKNTRLYKGIVYKIKTNTESATSTDNHRWVCKLDDSYLNEYCSYVTEDNIEDVKICQVKDLSNIEGNFWKLINYHTKPVTCNDSLEPHRLKYPENKTHYTSDVHYRNACNMDFGIMVYTNKWKPIDVVKAYDECEVVSLDVSNNHLYYVNDILSHNSIYGFRGADSDAFGKLTQAIAGENLELDISYRCGKKIVELAQTLVPMIKPRNDAQEGEVQYYKDHWSSKIFNENDMIVCRLNAPLTNLFWKIKKEQPNKKVYIRGISMGQRLCDVVKSIVGNDVWVTISGKKRKLVTCEGVPLAKLKSGIKTWLEDRIEYHKLNGNMNLIARDKDIHDSIVEFMKFDDINDCEELCDLITSAFADENKDAIVLSTIHKAKGLEADRVFIYKYDLIERIGSNPNEQLCLKYVAITRAKTHLGFID